jgi:GDPmannose 4,6-dehydratase
MPRFLPFAIGIREDVELASVALNDFRSVLQVLFKVRPDEIYNLAGQSSVSLSFEQPMEPGYLESLGGCPVHRQGDQTL